MLILYNTETKTRTFLFLFKNKKLHAPDTYILYMGAVVHHLVALLLVLVGISWPGYLAHPVQQNWYIPAVKPDGVVDGGLLMCIIAQTVMVVVICIAVVRGL
jgi:hypothetical protein